MATVSVTAILKTEEHEAAFAYFNDSTLSIEIIKDDVLQKIYFRVKDKVSWLYTWINLTQVAIWYKLL